MLQALGNTIIIRPIFEEKKSNLIIPKSAKEYKQYCGQVLGEVISIGEKYKYKNDIIAGDKIVFQRHEGFRFWYEGVMYLKLRERWVHGRIEKEK